MNIEIRNTDLSGVNGYEIIDLDNGGPAGRLIHNYNNHFTGQRYFDEEEIINLLNSGQYKQFEAGKYEFEVTKKRIFAVSNDINYFSY